MAKVMNAGTYATEGERRTAEVLRSLPAEWVIITNKILATSNDRSFEIDFIVLGDHLVFVLDEKGWRGRIHGSDALWVRSDGFSERSPLNKTDYVARLLAGHLRAKVPLLSSAVQQFVRGGVVLSAAERLPLVRDPRVKDGIVLLADAVEHLQQLDAAAGTSSLSGIRDHMVHTLLDLSDRPKIPHRIGMYTIEEVMAERGDVSTFLARHEEGDERMLVVYNLQGRSEEQRNFYLQEARALKHLRDTGLVPHVLDPFEWSDDFLVVPYARPTGTPLCAFNRLEGADAGERELALAATAFRALASMHAKGIVHRSLSADNVYVRDTQDGFGICLTDFHAARHGTKTIGQHLDDLRVSDPYAAPEIGVGYGFASQESDTYSLALIFLERFSGVPVKRLVQENGRVDVAPDEASWAYLPDGIVADLQEFFRRALSLGPMAAGSGASNRRLSAQECATMLDGCVQTLRGATAPAPEKLLDNRYRMERILGQGASARTLLVTDTEVNFRFAVKQYLRPEVIREYGDVKREFLALQQLSSRHLPKVYDVYPPTSDVHVKLEYIEGVSLAQRLSYYEGHVERWTRLAADLFTAVELLEERHIQHRDIKPENVLLRDETDEAVLIDFGSAALADTVVTPAGTPRYIPLESLLRDEACPTRDRYALAVLLFQALTGVFPFTDGIDQQHPVAVASLPPWLRSYAGALLRAVDPNPANRYGSAAEFRSALFAAGAPSSTDHNGTLREEVNEWVDELRRLYRNSVQGNAENRGLDSDFARATYVSTALDDRLLPAILRNLPHAVFLSGNPGDGKTAFLEQVRHALQEAGGSQVSGDESGWVWQLDGRTFRACYDASESHGQKSADEQLIERLAGLEGGTTPTTALTVLVAINDGRLADFVDHHRGRFAWLASQVDLARESADETGDVWVVDLKRRAYVKLAPDTDQPSVLQRMIQIFTDTQHWNVCFGCAAQYVCPIRRNAQVLGGATTLSAAERLEHVLLLTHLRGQRHLTIRDLRSGLAYLITGDTGCADIHAMRKNALPVPPIDYWRLAFTTDDRLDTMLGELRPVDPARFAQPSLERFLFFRHAPGDTPERAELFGDVVDLAPESEIEEWIGLVKRRLYFEGAKPDVSRPDLPRLLPGALLPYHFGHEFLAVLRGDLPAGALLERIARGIGRSDGINGQALARGLCLRVVHSDAQRLTVLKQFPVSDFELGVLSPPGGEQIEAVPQVLLLRHRRSSGQLLITLDLFEMLLRFAAGLEAESPELQPLLEDLQPFKSAVLLSNTIDLVLIEAGRRLHYVTQQSGEVVRRPMEQN